LKELKMGRKQNESACFYCRQELREPEPIHFNGRRCHYCGQELIQYRLNVPMTPLKALIFDRVLCTGRDGISGDRLFDLTLGKEHNGSGTHDRPPQRAALKAHIAQINRALKPTGYRIEGKRGDRSVSVFRLIGPDFDPLDDVRKSVAEGFRAIRARVAAGGPGWGNHE
jgi:hypothetical protein